MLGPIQSFFTAVSAQFLAGASVTHAEAAAASRAIPVFELPSVGRTFEDRTSSILTRLGEALPAQRGALAENFDWLARVSKSYERPFYNEATHHIDRLLQLDPWNDGENTSFEYMAYQILEAILVNRDIAGFVLFLSVMGGRDRHERSLEAMARHEKMEKYFGLVDGVFPTSEKCFGYGQAAQTVLSLDIFGPVRSEILRFLSTAVLKKGGRIPSAGVFSGAYFDSAQKLIDVFGYGLTHPELGPRAREAIRVAAAHSFGFLKMNRLVHVLMRREFEGKISEFVPESRGLIRRMFVKDGTTEALAGIEACLRSATGPETPTSGSFSDLLLANPTPHSKRLARELGTTVAFESHAGKAFEAVVRLSKRRNPETVWAIYGFPSGVNGEALIQVKKSSPYEEAALALHEFVHVEQERRQGLGWANRHVLEAEREALSVETLFRVVNGDRRLYDIIAALSPQGFEAGLWIVTEQLYLRLRDLPL